MEFSTQIVNISKIKEGFYIGDRATGLNLDLLMQFKITHMINASGNRLINAFETIGIKYLTLNWSENSRQNLFDPKDNIANVIVSFIDDALKNGEGLLAHSIRGQNRVCVVVLIYLMKKYKWGLMKSIDFLNSKKVDADVQKYFLSQLSQFESRLFKEGSSQSMGWSDDNNFNDKDEQVMRNTYVNGLLRKANYNNNNVGSYYQLGKNGGIEKKRIGWGDCNPYCKNDTLIHSHTKQDLLLQKEINPITNHFRLQPKKSCIKQLIKYQVNNCKNNTNYTPNTSVNSNSNFNSSFAKVQDMNKNSLSNHCSLTPSLSTHHSFNRNTPSLIQASSFNKNSNESGNYTSNDRNSYLINNFNDDFNSHTFDKRNNSSYNHNRHILKDIMNTPLSPNERIANANDNEMIISNKRDRLMKRDSFNSNEKKHNINNGNSNSKNHKKGANNFLVNINNNSNKNGNIPNQQFQKENPEDMLLKNNCIINNYTNYQGLNINSNVNDNKLLKIVDSRSLNNKMLNQYGKSLSQNKNQMSLPFDGNCQPKMIKVGDENQKNPHFIISQNKPLNNFDPSQLKKGQTMFNRPRSGTNQQMPITLPKDLIKKPLTPDHTLYHSLKSEKNKANKLQSNHLYTSMQKQPHSHKYNHSKDMNDPILIRPSTAPQKDKQNKKAKLLRVNSNATSINSNSLKVQNPFYPGLIRLPSPMNKSSNTYQLINYPHQKYRAPSPMIKSSYGHFQYNNISLIK